MADFRQVQDDRIRQLAQTLKNNGLAASESEAVSMATSMARTENKIIENYDAKKEGAVMNTGGRRVQTSSQPQSRPAVHSQNSFSPAVSREKEVVVQEEAARPAPAHSNSAIAHAISNVKDVFNQPQSIDLDESFNDDAPLSEIMDEEFSSSNENPFLSSSPVQQSVAQPVFTAPAPAPVQSVVERPLPQEEFITRPVAQEPQPQAVAQVPKPVQEEEEVIEEHTREIFEKAPRKDLSQFAESRISLADVFNANR